MYTAFYELRQEPFHVTPDPEFLFPSPAHKEALAAIIYGIEQRKGFVAITGEVGVGKTTILRSYLELADRKNLKLIYIYNSNLTFEELLTTLFQELGIAERPATTFMAVNRLHEELIEIYRKNNTVVLIVDEAQNMPVETLESLRMLSNLETVSEKLVQIVLIGQPEFDEMLQQHRLRQLRQRIAIHARINPLTLEDSVAYLTHRLNRVALSTRPVFSKQALRMIAEAAMGIPRTLNILSDNALITGFGYQARPVDARVVKEVLSDRRLVPEQPRRRIPWAAGAAAAAAAALLVSIFAFGPQLLATSGLTTAVPESIAAVERATARLRDWAASEGKPAPDGGRGAGPNRAEAPASAPRGVPDRPPDPVDVPARPTPRAVAPSGNADAPSPPRPEATAPAPVAPPSPPRPPVASPSATPAISEQGAVAGDPPRGQLPSGTVPQRPPERPIPLRNDQSNLAALPPPAASPPSAPRAPVARPTPAAPTAPVVTSPPAPGAAGVTPRPGRPDGAVARPELLVRTVRFGDNLWTMAEDVYGFVNPNILRKVQDANPQIRNINVLAPGQEVLFPRDPDTLPDRTVNIIDLEANRPRGSGRN